MGSAASIGGNPAEENRLCDQGPIKVPPNNLVNRFIPLLQWTRTAPSRNRAMSKDVGLHISKFSRAAKKRRCGVVLCVVV